MTRAAALLSRRLSTLGDARPDGELLAVFVADRDEVAFAELVRRHGPLVWGACRRLLPDVADAEDAFQATFLVLVRRARRLTRHPAVGPWLYRVAVWTARNARRRNARQLARRVPLSPAEAAAPSHNDLKADLDAALLALPEKYRTPLVLCHLQGWSRREAADRLGCPEGTLSSLLSRGLDRLRQSLKSHDPAKLLALGGSAVPAVLLTNTVKAAVAGEVAAAGVISLTVSQLVEGVLHMFWVKKATAAAVGLFVVFGAGVGVGLSGRPVPANADDDPPAAAAKRGLFETPKPAAGVAPSDAKALEAELATLRAELAATEELLQAALKGVQLAREKAALTQAARDKGTVAAGEVIQDQLAVTQFEEKAATAKLQRATVLGRLTAAEAKLKAWAPQQKPAANPLGVKMAVANDDLELTLARLAADAEATRKRAAEMQAEMAQLADRQKLIESRMAELKRAQAERAAKVKPAAPPDPTANFLFHLTVSADAQWPFRVKEYDHTGQGVGTVGFENAPTLARFLARAAKEPGAPAGLGVRLLVPKDAPADRTKAAEAAVKAAGLQVATTVAATPPPAGGPPGTTPSLTRTAGDRFGTIVSGREAQAERMRAEAARAEAEAQAALAQALEAKYQQQIEELTRQLEALKKSAAAKPPAGPADPPKKPEPKR